MPICANQSYSNKPEYVRQSATLISCKETGEICYFQYWCGNDQRYKLLDRAPVACKKFKPIQ